MGGVSLTKTVPVEHVVCHTETRWETVENTETPVTHEDRELTPYEETLAYEMFTSGTDYSKLDLPPGVVLIPSRIETPTETPSEVPLSPSWIMLILGLVCFYMVVRKGKPV